MGLLGRHYGRPDGVGVSLRAWGFNLNFAEQASVSGETAIQTVQLRSVDAALLTPESPVKGWLQGWRNWFFDESVEKPNNEYAQRHINDLWHSGVVTAIDLVGVEGRTNDYKPQRLDFWVVFVGGLLLIFVAEPLFAFRSLLGIKPTNILSLNLTYLAR